MALFSGPRTLQEWMPRLLNYSTLYFAAHEVMAFLGRKLSGNFLGDVVTDQVEFRQRPKRLPGRRVKHRMKRNWMKMYSKQGAVLRVETVINDPEEFRIRRRVRRQGRTVMAWTPLRKGVAYLSRYEEICGQCNGRYLDALAQVDDPTPAIGALDALSSRAATGDGRTVRPFNPVARQERTLFEVLMSGEHTLHGFTNRQLRDHLVRVGYPLAAEVAKQSGQVTRLLRRHAHPSLDRQDSAFPSLACLPQRSPRDGGSSQAT